jgi:single-strand DNA-binding protein
MAGVNKAIILGRLGKDPEVRTFQNGGKVVSLRIATSERYKDREGQQQEKTEWHAVSIFNEKLGEIAEKYLKKGSEVYIEGQIETRKWQDQTGADRYSTEIVLRQFRGELSLVGGRAGGGSDSGDMPERSERSERPAPAKSSGGWDSGARKPSKATDLDDDIPF